MIEQFLHHFNRLVGEKQDLRILVAASGGLDSMVLLSLCQQTGVSLGVAHCNFQLRGEESEGDEHFLKIYCSQHNIPLFVKRFNTKSFAEENGLSVQMAARHLRYEWFQEILEQEMFTCLATAHHLNDSIETVVLNWVRGSSTDGFAGIPEVNRNIIRPLLFATRDEILNYAIEKKIEWREDSSNESDDYQRNFLRHQVIPKLKELNPSLEKTIQQSIRKTKDDLIFIEHTLEAWKHQQIKVKDGVARINKDALTSLPTGIVARLLQPYGLKDEQCEQLMASLSGQSGKKFLSQSHLVVIDRQEVIISPLVVNWNDCQIERHQSEAVLGSFELHIEESQPVPSANAGKAVLDASKLQYPLVWRKWRSGDYFYPLGMEQKRKLSDFLIDNKVSVAEKHFVTVLVSGGEIAWVVGHRIDNRFKLTAPTTQAVCFTLKADFR
jgi:tRNA(Ile)-lysidine synthase